MPSLAKRLGISLHGDHLNKQGLLIFQETLELSGKLR